jgi:Cysteine rich repeat
MPRPNPFLVALLALAAFTETAGVQAQTLAQALAQRDTALYKACGTDLRKHCSTVLPGNGRVLACLQQQGSGLSATCQAQLPQLAQCSQELQRLCPEATPAQWRACFESKREQFSPACQQMAPR